MSTSSTWSRVVAVRNVGLALLALLVAVIAPFSTAQAEIPAKGECYLIDFTYDDGDVDDGVHCGTGNELNRTNTPGLHAITLHVSCSDPFTDGYGVKSNLDGHHIQSWSIKKYKDGQLNKECGGEPGLAGEQPTTPPVGQECFVIDFQYLSGLSDTGTFCGTGNDIDRTEVPTLVANKLHVSCSDKFYPDGTAEKSDLDGQLVVSWSIQRWHDDHFHDPCSGTTSATDTGDTGGDTTVPARGECFVIDFVYNDGDTDAGVFCGTGNDIDRNEVPGLHAVKLHVSCSDLFPGGVAQKSDLGGHTVASWSIKKYKDGVLNKECGDADTSDDGTGGGTTPDGVQPNGDCFVIDFQYTNGTSDTGTFCGTGNDIDRTEAPDLNAVRLHVSCSDTIYADGTAEKSDLGGLLVHTWSIKKYKDGVLNKECGGTTDAEPPTPVTYCYDISFNYSDNVTSSGGGFDAGYYCVDDATVDRGDDPYLEAISLDVSCTEVFGANGETSTSVLPDGYTVTDYAIQIFADGELVDACSGSF